MVAEGVIETPLHGSSVDDDSSIHSEMRALTEFANRLGSCVSTNEPGFADEGDTRQEAKLLMSLLSSPSKEVVEGKEGLSSYSSSSEQSYISDSSYSSRRDLFSFTCPSLSLERRVDTLSRESAKRCASGDLIKGKSRSTQEIPTPAVLLGRRLKVDDRDALRLSADAMARNVVQSFHKAIQWRIKAWICSLSSVLVRREREMKLMGMTNEDVKNRLISTGEVQLIRKLGEVPESISVLGAVTSFRVLPQRVERKSSPEEPSVSKKQRCDSYSSSSGMEEDGDYQYKVAHALTFQCTVNLHTAAGFSEITLEVPGTIEGTFLSMEPGVEEMTSVVVELETNILAAMVEKSCRTIVRSSVEETLKNAPLRGTKETKDVAAPQTATAQPTGVSLLTPPPPASCSSRDGDFVRPAFVTPRQISSDDSTVAQVSSSPSLLPIPDDFDKEAQDPEITRGFRIAPRTPFGTSFRGRPSVVSPQAVPSTEYAKVTSKSPSLPMLSLVEVAVRAMHSC